MAGLEHDVRSVSALRKLVQRPWQATVRAVRACAARPRLSLLVWGIVIAMLASGVGVLWWQDHRHDQVGQARSAAVEAARDSLGKILTYESASVEQDLRAAQQSLTGNFKEDFGALARDVVAPASKRDDISTSAEVVGTAVVSATSDSVVVLAYVNQTTKSKALDKPRVDNSRLRVSLTRVGDTWLVSDLKPV